MPFLRFAQTSAFCSVATLVVGLTLSGCGSSVSGTAAPTPVTPPTPVATPAPVLTLSVATLGFPATTIGQTSPTQSVALSNTGTAALTISSLVLSDTKNYSMLSTCGATLAIGASCTLSIAFAPQTAASLPATLTIATNATPASQTITLTGTGTVLPVATASVSVTSLMFPATAATTNASPQLMTLTNSGTATLNIVGVTISGSNTNAFTDTTNCGTKLAAGSSCAISVTFTPPLSSMSYAGTLVVTDNSGGVAGATQTVSLSGSSTTPVPVPAPQAALSAASLVFPVTAAGSASTVQMVTLSNVGNAALTGLSVALGGANANAFTLTTNCASTLAAGSSCSLSASFMPTASSSTYSANLLVMDNSGNVAGATQSVALTGTSAAAMPQAVLSGSSLTFAATNTGSSATAQSVSLTNSGNATLTGLGFALSGPGAASFSQNNTCGTSVAAGASCTIMVNFMPAATGALSASLSVSSNASTSPQVIALMGSGTAPAVTLSSTSVLFPATTVGATATSMVTLTNSGSGALTLSSITLGGANSSNFGLSTTCPPTLAAGGNCTLTLNFTPSAATSYSASVTLTDNAANSPQTVALSGSGNTSALTHQFYAFPESDLSVTPLYALVNGAKSTIDMTMYELVDTTFSADLVAACNRGVKVRVILDQSLEKSSNTAAYNQLNATPNCSAMFSNLQFQATHEKSFIIDSRLVAIMSLNLTSRYYSTTRDYAEITNDPADIAAVQATFNTDFGSSTDFSYQPGPGSDLIWSPTTAQPDLLGIINGATKTLLVENEEMSATSIINALAAACQRGVTVQIAMTDTGSYHAGYKTLDAAGCGVHLYADNATTLYIHGKSLVADYGLPTQSVYMGSINFSNASMTQNRELGLYLYDAASVQALASTIMSDYAGAPTSTY